jgi:hypothetical protein
VVGISPVRMELHHIFRWRYADHSGVSVIGIDRQVLHVLNR